MSKAYLGELTPPKDKEEQGQRLDFIMHLIDTDPKLWNQVDWHCETSHCFAGLCQMHARNLPWDLNFDRNDDERTTAEVEKEAEEKGYTTCNGNLWINSPVFARVRRTSALEDATIWLGLRDDWADRLFAAVNMRVNLRSVIHEIKSDPESLSPHYRRA